MRTARVQDVPKDAHAVPQFETEGSHAAHASLTGPVQMRRRMTMNDPIMREPVPNDGMKPRPFIPVHRCTTCGEPTQALFTERVEPPRETCTHCTEKGCNREMGRSRCGCGTAKLWREERKRRQHRATEAADLRMSLVRSAPPTSRQPPSRKTRTNRHAGPRTDR